MAKATLKNTAARIGRFRTSQDGAVAAWWAILMVPILGFTFGTIKFTEYTEQRANMNDAMDASALAMARWIKLNDKEPCDVATGTSPEDLADNAAVKRYGREYFIKNYPQHGVLYGDETLGTPFDPVQHLEFDMTCSTIVAQADAFSDMGGVLATYFGIGALPIGVDSEITLPGSGKVEISVVVDVSGSMKNADMKRFRTAMGAMADELFGEAADAENENVRIGVVPFNSVVNPGKALANANPGWFDHAAGSPFHGANFIDFREQDDPTGLMTEQHRLVSASQTVNHFDLFRSVPGVGWAGCVEARPFPLDEVPDAPGTPMPVNRYQEATTLSSDFEQEPKANGAVKNRMAAAWSELPTMDLAYKTSLNSAHASRYVPWFYPDEADCDQMPDWTGEPGVKKDNSDKSNGKRCRRLKAEDGTAPTYLKEDTFGTPRSLYDGANHDSLKEDEYRNRYFVRDKLFIDWKGGEEENVRPYHRFALEFRNAAGWANSKQSAFKDSLQDDYGDFVAAARRVGLTDVLDDGKVKLGDNQEYRLRQGYVGLWDDDSNTYKGKYDLYDASTAGGTGPNRRCGPALLPLTSKRQTLMNYVNALSANGGTNSAMGMAWGWNMLTPVAPLSGAVDMSDPVIKKQWRKFVILMSDGKNNVNTRDTHMLTDRMAYGYGFEDRLNIVTQTSPSSSQIASKYDREMDNKTIRICNRMEAEGIKVFAVGYGLNRVKDSTTRNDIETMLKACANSADGTQIIGADGNPTGVTYVRADNEAALKKAFRDITDAIEDLHISG